MCIRDRLIGAAGLRSEGGKTDKIRPRQGLIVRHPEILINDTRLPLWGGEAGEYQEAKGLPHSVATAPATVARGLEGLIKSSRGTVHPSAWPLPATLSPAQGMIQAPHPSPLLVPHWKNNC